MEIRLWGTRGSIPSPGPSTARYGGNTSCVEVRLSDGSLIILDAGSGIRPLGAALGECACTLLISHYHWDHIQGLPFFGPAFTPGSAIRIVGPSPEGRSPRDILACQMLTPYFPTPMETFTGIQDFDVVQPGSTFEVGNASITACRLSHPGLTLGYRIEDAGHVLVYMSDDEPDLAPPEMVQDIIDLARGADVLLHDCQYFEEEYPARRGWGHSTPRQATRIAREAGARQLIMFHHDPSHPDEQVEALAEQVQRLARGFDVLIAREGDQIRIQSELPVGPEPASGDTI